MELSSSSSPSAVPELVHDFHFLKVFNDGRVQKLFKAEKILPADDPVTGVKSRDVTISSNVSVRIFLPKLTTVLDRKLPVLLYIHGGAFALESAFSPCYHTHVSMLAAEANAVCVSIEYRLAPENPVSACYDDCWEALQWLVAMHHGNGDQGPDQWINQHANLSRVFIAGDSAGGNIAYNLAVRVGKHGLPPGVNLIGSVLVHPYFFVGSVDQIDQMWLYIAPDNKGLTDPRIKPDRNDLKVLAGEGILVMGAGEDEYHLRDRGLALVEEVKRSGWNGKLEWFETPGEGHCFHLRGDFTRPVAMDLIKRIVSFINEDKYFPVPRL